MRDAKTSSSNSVPEGTPFSHSKRCSYLTVYLTLATRGVGEAAGDRTVLGESPPSLCASSSTLFSPLEISLIPPAPVLLPASRSTKAAALCPSDNSLGPPRATTVAEYQVRQMPLLVSKTSTFSPTAYSRWASRRGVRGMALGRLGVLGVGTNSAPFAAELPSRVTRPMSNGTTSDALLRNTGEVRLGVVDAMGVSR